MLCWNIADYMEESLVKPVVGRLWSTLKPGGMLLAFFHTKEAGPDSPCYRFHILGNDMLEMQPIESRAVRKGPTGAVHTAVGGGFRLQRVFNNRHIETLFRDFGSIKFFLASTSEVYGKNPKEIWNEDDDLDRGTSSGS